MTKFDVVVGGGGLAGCAAAIAAGRQGASTILIERYGSLGGMATNGLVAPFMKYHAGNKQLVSGLFQEIIDRLNNFSNDAIYIRAFDPEALKMVLYDFLLESGVQLLLHSYITGVIKKDKNIKAIIIENKSGKSKIDGKIFIDATGDGDIGAKSGVQIQIGDDKGQTQALTLMFRIGNVNIKQVIEYCKKNKEHFRFIEHDNIVSIAGFSDLIEKERKNSIYSVPLDYIFFTTSPRKDIIVINSTRILNVSALNANDLTKAEIEGHRQAWMIFKLLKQNVPGFKNSYLMDTATQVGVRATRRIIGEYILTKEDILNCRKFPDAIAHNNYPIDIHSPVDKEGKWMPLPEGEYYDIPYGCLVVKGVDNLFVAGRCISCTHEAQGSIRIMPVCIATGEAAGRAASKCLTLWYDQNLYK